MTGLVGQLVVRRPDGFVLAVDLDLPAGTTVALLGPNGSGKSTTAEVIAGLIPLDDGRLELRTSSGPEVWDDAVNGVFVPPERRRVGLVFQQYLLFEHLSVLENVAFGPRRRGLGRREASDRAHRQLEAMSLVDFAQRRPAELSGGQAQRVALARALAMEPTVLVLDEPLAALDVATRAELRRMLADHLAGFDGPRLLITHDPTDAYLLADRIDVLEGGRITQSGPPSEIRRRPATNYVAALAGVNLLRGRSAGGRIRLVDHEADLTIADTSVEGEVLVTIRPNAVALHEEQPHGSPRNTWASRIETVEPLGDITRVSLGPPLPLSVDITAGAASSLEVAPGRQIWVSIKATEIDAHPA